MTSDKVTFTTYSCKPSVEQFFSFPFFLFLLKNGNSELVILKLFAHVISCVNELKTILSSHTLIILRCW